MHGHLLLSGGYEIVNACPQDIYCSHFHAETRLVCLNVNMDKFELISFYFDLFKSNLSHMQIGYT